jgi:hypothetical protein
MNRRPTTAKRAQKLRSTRAPTIADSAAFLSGRFDFRGNPGGMFPA